MNALDDWTFILLFTQREGKRDILLREHNGTYQHNPHGHPALEKLAWYKRIWVPVTWFVRVVGWQTITCTRLVRLCLYQGHFTGEAHERHDSTWTNWPTICIVSCSSVLRKVGQTYFCIETASNTAFLRNQLQGQMLLVLLQLKGCTKQCRTFFWNDFESRFFLLKLLHRIEEIYRAFLIIKLSLIIFKDTPNFTLYDNGGYVNEIKRNVINV
jgi:hypothetical protein